MNTSPPIMRRRGLTLVELLVVISILVILTAAAVPAMRPALEGRRIREAARAINVYLGSARNRALESGRPCGVMLSRLPGIPEVVMSLDQVETPAPYGGDDDATLAKVQIGSFNAQTGETVLVANFNKLINKDLINEGDQIQFNYQGPFYRIVSYDPNTKEMKLTASLFPGQMLPWPNAGGGNNWSRLMPFKIYRRPVKSSAAALQLPAGAVIDLESSGADNAPTWQTGNAPIVLMFSPNGSIDGLYFEDKRHVVVQPLFLLVGKRENVPSSLTGVDNWKDLNNLWVTINPQTGLVTTIEVAKPTSTDPAVAFQESRDLARKAQSMGGR